MSIFGLKVYYYRVQEKGKNSSLRKSFFIDWARIIEYRDYEMCGLHLLMK